MQNKNQGQKKTDLNKVWNNRKTANVVGHLIRKLRWQHGLTQEQLSARCQVRGLNLSRGTLAKIEARIRFIKAYELFIIAKALHVPMEHFFSGQFR